MKQATSEHTTTRQSERTAQQDASAGQNAISMAPPAYGIDFVDRDLMGEVPVQRSAASSKQTSETPGVQQKNKTGLPDKLKAGVESLSGLSMDDVSVHYNSAKPAPLQALAYTQGTDIHVAPGQERHLPHEAWHVVQQKQGRVKPTLEAKGVAINDDEGLEREADVMGAKALQMRRPDQFANGPAAQATTAGPGGREPTEASEVPSVAIGASGEKARLTFLSTSSSREVIQKTDVEVLGGKFKDLSYRAINEEEDKYYNKGGEMVLKFKPDPLFELDNEILQSVHTISLVQSVRDQTLLVTETMEMERLERPEAALASRTSEGGFAIDQQIYGKGGEIESLDPRYAEFGRTSPETPVKKKPTGLFVLPEQKVYEATRKNGEFTDASLRDRPNVRYEKTKTLKGGMDFEVAAMAETDETSVFIGSVLWGWRIGDNNEAELNPDTLQLGEWEQGSDAFFKAVEAWNRSRYPEQMGTQGPLRQPLQLPPKVIQ